MKLRAVIRPVTALCAATLLSWSASSVTAAARTDAYHPAPSHSTVRYSTGSNATTPGPPLTYHGGINDGGTLVGVETSPAVFIVYWGWSSDPSGEAAYQQKFFNAVGGSSWNASVTQYCQGAVSTGSSTCPTGATFAGNPAGVLKGVWSDNGNVLPKRISQSALAAEADRASSHFGNGPVANQIAQYVIATPTGHSTSGFGTRFCAWHSSMSSTLGNGLVAYTNFPYQTDAGAACGQNFVNSGSAGTLDGVSIVGGHEFAETETDQFPNGGWLDSSGAENGDKCAWISSGQGAATDITLTTGSFAVQSLWSNSFVNQDNTKGNCVISFP